MAWLAARIFSNRLSRNLILFVWGIGTSIR